MTSTVWWNRTVGEFVQEAGSAEPTPGGGSVAALAAALGASMASMASRLSQGEAFAALQTSVGEVLETMNRLTGACEELLEADIRAFEEYMRALKLPKESEEERAARRSAIDEAAASATAVPLRLMQVCLEGLRAAERIAEGCNKHVVSDLGIGALLFEASAQSAGLTVRINLSSLRNADLAAQYDRQVSAMLQEAEALKTQVLRTVHSRIAGH
ncbi:cyclodeaminase/cyclohydrolase family protein [Paenibacillus elgii]|uniref:cyclodeaminase/cyclohydrolase family protein n=1 Tax=Paenibacillus elgii TaxID=189691 RepID=UPI0013D647A6|nr:cyclodeaminase/cyclohydrolase family protein [Paenibacillus elgii]